MRESESGAFIEGKSRPQYNTFVRDSAFRRRALRRAYFRTSGLVQRKRRSGFLEYAGRMRREMLRASTKPGTSQKYRRQRTEALHSERNDERGRAFQHSSRRKKADVPSVDPSESVCAFRFLPLNE